MFYAINDIIYANNEMFLAIKALIITNHEAF
jgi:hypothetical protein